MVYVALTIGGAVLAVVVGTSVHLRRRLERANEPKCPVCRSRELDGIEGEDEEEPGVLTDEFRCRDCGLAPADLDSETRELVDALRDLQDVEVPLVEAQNSSFGLPTPKSTLGRNREAGDWKENRVMEVWDGLRRVRENHPEAFEVPLAEDAERTAGELLTGYLQGEEGGTAFGGSIDYLSDLELQFIDREAEKAMETIREAIAAAVRRRCDDRLPDADASETQNQ